MTKLEDVRVDVWHRTIEGIDATYRLVPDDDGSGWRVSRVRPGAAPWEALGWIAFDLRGRPRAVPIEGAPPATSELLTAIAEVWKANHGDLVPGTPTLRPPHSAP